MSTDLRNRTSPPSPEEGPDQHDKPKSSLNITQVVGGALAAMTAAALGSRLSVAGTVIGAAFASVIAAVGGSIYTASLRRTGQHVSTVLAKVRPTSGGAPAPGGDAPAGTRDTAATTSTATDWALPDEPAHQASSTTVPEGRRAWIGWKPVVAAAVLMFAIAAVALTGIELVTGHALSGGTGTTVGQVADGGAKPSSRPTGASTASPSATPSTTRSAAPSTSPSSTPSSEPTAAPSGSDSAAPSATPTPTASASPSGSSARATPAS